MEKLQNEIAQAAKKTGIASAARLATIAPKKEIVSIICKIIFFLYFTKKCSSDDDLLKHFGHLLYAKISNVNYRRDVGCKTTEMFFT